MNIGFLTHFILVTSRTIRGHICVSASHQFHGNLISQQQETNIGSFRRKYRKLLFMVTKYLTQESYKIRLTVKSRNSVIRRHRKESENRQITIWKKDDNMQN